MYNAQDNIGNCLNSLLKQDLSEDDYEIIIMDDGSKDNSVTIVEDYMKLYNNIQLYKESNSGCYSTRNKLLKLAKGDYIYNLDADDYIVHNCLSILLDIASGQDVDLICFKTLETKDFSRTTLSTPITEKEFEIISGRELLEKEWKMRYEIWWYFVKRTFLETHQMVFNNNEYNADVEFTLHCLLRAKQIAYLPLRIHRYVQTNDSLMRSSNFEIIKKRLFYSQMMIINLSKIINNLKQDDLRKNVIMLQNLSHRRDIFTFFHMVNMVKYPFSLEYIKRNIKELELVDAYPIINFIRKEYDSLKYKLLLFIINRIRLFYPLIAFKNIFYHRTNQNSLES